MHAFHAASAFTLVAFASTPAVVLAFASNFCCLKIVRPPPLLLLLPQNCASTASIVAAASKLCLHRLCCCYCCGTRDIVDCTWKPPLVGDFFIPFYIFFDFGWVDYVPLLLRFHFMRINLFLRLIWIFLLSLILVLLHWYSDIVALAEIAFAEILQFFKVHRIAFSVLLVFHAPKFLFLSSKFILN